MNTDWRVPPKLARFFHALEQLAGYGGATFDTTIYVSKTNPLPHCVGNHIHLPHPSLYDYDYPLIARSFLHELSHAVDYTLKTDDGREQAERRARLAERAVDPTQIEQLVLICNLPFPNGRF
jgi:hypothetical protein